jgi:hypothetical protein
MSGLIGPSAAGARHDRVVAGIQRRALLVGAAACGLGWADRAMGAALSSLPVPPSGAMAFRLMRHGSPIGEHTLAFEQRGDTLTVAIAVDVVVSLGPIPLVRYTHRNTEVWQAGRLVGLAAQTNRNGTELHMAAHRDAAGLRVEGSGATPYIAPEDALPTTYWNARMLRVPMIGTQDGILVHPKVVEKPVEPVRLASGAETAARPYSLRGDLDLDLWYAGEGDWMSMRFTVADGSEIKYERL